jgi:hypothetical protein
LAERAICIQHALIRATLGRLPVEDLATFESLLIVTRDLMRQQSGPSADEAPVSGATGERGTL